MFWITGGVILLAALPALLNVRAAPLELLANLRPQIAVLILAFGAAAFTVGRYGTAGLAAGVLALLLLSTPELFSRAPRPVDRPDLILVWANVFKSDAATERLAQLARRRGADLVILGEPPAPEAARRLLADYPFHYGVHDPRRHGAAIFSRRPLIERAEPDLPSGSYPVSVVEADGLTVAALHPPVAVSRRRLAESELMLADAAAALDGRAGVMVGDMNATPWSVRLRELSRRLTRISPARASTWFSSLPVLGLPIDHAFVTPGLEASAEIGPGIGSDHLPLIVSVSRAAIPQNSSRPAA